MSTLEHASFTFGIEGISRSAHIQIIRHRIASYSVQSQRYVSLRDFEHVVPREIEEDPEAYAEYLAAMESAGKHYNRIADILQSKGKNVKAANENARAVLPNSCGTKMMMTMNARSLHNFFALRCCERAQAEIRELAGLMLAQAKAAAPLLFAKAGPPCIRAGCPEGAMSCGKTTEMREKYAAG
jgi:thymidylate synthase (FAD)